MLFVYFIKIDYYLDDDTIKSLKKAVIAQSF